MIHLRILNTMPPLFGTSFFLCCSFRDCGCGKAMSFDDFFRRERKRDKNWRYKDKVKLTFSHGASLPDPDKLFNAGLGGNAWRAIDFFEGDKINERALKNLVRAAVDYNQIKLKSKAPADTRAKVHKSKKG